MATSSQSSDKELIKGVVEGKVKPYRLDEMVGPDRAQAIRLEAYRKMTKLPLAHISESTLKASQCGPNIENMIGSIQVPLGIAGPLKVNGESAKGDFLIPLATTEGALVASVNRGCSVIDASGGAQATIIESGQTRSILFRTSSSSESKRLCGWVKSNAQDIAREAKGTEKFIEILGVETYMIGTSVWVRLVADTKDAMGMNMVTVAGKRAGTYIALKNRYATFAAESGNMCIDKKPSSLTLIKGRGKKVSAEVRIAKDTIEKVLKTDADSLIDLNYRKNLLGSALAGSQGYNAHFANIIAALFIATGQDAAHVVDGSHGFTTVEKAEDGVLFGVTLTALHVGTVGGGTGVPAQRECLEMLGVAGPGNPPGSNSLKLAEIAASAVLAGEISLLGALCAGNLTDAHLKHNR